MSTNTDSCGRKVETYLSENKYTSSIYKFWVKYLPGELRLSKALRNVRLPIGLFVQLCGLAMFLTFLIMGVNTAKKASFLSLDKNAGNCDDVKIEISETFSLDYNGYWSTNSNYDDSKSVFEVQFIGVQMNQAEYNSLIKDIIYPYLKGLNMQNKNWIENYLIWTKSDVKKFNYSGGIINLRIQGTDFSYQNDYYVQTCDVASGSCKQLKESTTSTMNSFDTQAYSSILKSYYMNSAIPFVDPEETTKECDISIWADNSVLGSGPGLVSIYYPENANGLNDYVVKPYSMAPAPSWAQTTPAWTYEYLVNGDTIPVPGYCSKLFNQSSTKLYFPIIGNGLFKAAQNPTTYEYYNTLSETSSYSNECSTAAAGGISNDPTKLSVFIGLLELSYPNNVQCKTVNQPFGVYSDCAFENFYTQKAIDNRDTLNQKLFSLINIMNTNYDINALKNDPTLQEYLNFDAIKTVQLTQLTTENMGVYDKSLNMNGGLSAWDIQLTCYDSLGELGPFNPNTNAYNNAPTQLTENYYVCVPSDSSAFLDSFAIAVANTGTFMGIFLTVVITCYVTYVKYTSKTEISAVTSDDIEGMLEMLGTSLVNRNIARNKKEKLPPGYITNIFNELIEEEKSIEEGSSVELSTVENPVKNQIKSIDL